MVYKREISEVLLIQLKRYLAFKMKKRINLDLNQEQKNDFIFLKPSESDRTFWRIMLSHWSRKEGNTADRPAAAHRYRYAGIFPWF
jgi:hypothetical protein